MIIDNDGVVPFTAQLGSYHGINLQGGRPHFVEKCKDGGLVCDNRDKRYGCIGFNGSGVCSHTVAVAKFYGKLMHTCSILVKDLVVNPLEI